MCVSSECVCLPQPAESVNVLPQSAATDIILPLNSECVCLPQPAQSVNVLPQAAESVNVCV